MIDTTRKTIFSAEDISTAVAFLKSESPDLWESVRFHEQEDSWNADVARDVQSVLSKLKMDTAAGRVNLMLGVRKAARIELGLRRLQPITPKGKRTELKPVRSKYTPEQIQSAVELIKRDRPDLWKKWAQHELNDEGSMDIQTDLIRLLNRLQITRDLVEMVNLLFQVRIALRRELGLWVNQ
jgi:hypothetical protein